MMGPLTCYTETCLVAGFVASSPKRSVFVQPDRDVDFPKRGRSVGVWCAIMRAVGDRLRPLRALADSEMEAN